MSLLHVEGRHEADGELAVLGLAGPRDLRRIEIRRIVFLPNRETKSNVSQSSNSDNNNNKNTLYVHKQMAIGIAVMCVCACWDRFAFVFFAALPRRRIGGWSVVVLILFFSRTKAPTITKSGAATQEWGVEKEQKRNQKNTKEQQGRTKRHRKSTRLHRFLIDRLHLSFRLRKKRKRDPHTHTHSQMKT